ncbi:hypothetical protein H9Q73_000143 [Fusarium xylarioides]|nr:hypothetical protein H9Q73_000143 [Fusarium xylarioides]
MHKVFASDFFNFEFLRLLGTVPFQGAEVGECLTTAGRIKDGDPESWYRAWRDQADKAQALAEEAAAVGDKTGACWAYIRAANYWRASEFLLHCTPKDPRILASSKASVNAFDKGWVLLDATVRSFDIPYEKDIKLPGRLYLPAPHHRLPGKIPVVLQTGGFDSTQSSTSMVLLVLFPEDMPSSVLMDPVKGFPYVQVLDFVTEDVAPEYDLDLERLAIFGACLGGYLSLRAAVDPRIKACVSCDGPLDLFEITRSRMPPWFINGWLSGWVSDGVFNWVVDALTAVNFQIAWEFGHGKWVFGVETPADVLRVMQQISLKGGYLAKIKCPTLITGAADSFYFTPDINANLIFEGLTALGPNEKHLWIGKGVEGGGLQAKIGALAVVHHKMFTWLDSTFAIKRDVL